MSTTAQPEAEKGRNRPGPKLLGEEKRVRTTLCFDPQVLRQAKKYAKSLDKSLSLLIEELLQPHLTK